ncbi:MAG: sugar phosphate nucleotidyltransferase [Spirochaetota bacterium]
MKGFIFAAGFGTRVRPLTNTVPKPLLPICNVPSILYTLMLMKEAGIQTVVCNLHYLAEDIITYFHAHDNFGFDIHFTIEEEILGTGGGLKNCQQLLDDDSILLCNSDAIFDIHVAKLLETYRASGSLGMLVLKDTGMAERPVYVENEIIKDINYTFSSISHAPFAYTGMAVLSPEIFKYLDDGFSSIVYTGYTSLIQHHTLVPFLHRGFWIDVGTTESYHRVNMDILDNIEYWQARFNSLTGVSPLVTGDGVVFEDDARVYRTVTGEGSILGEGCRLQNSVLFPGSRIDPGRDCDSVIIQNDLVIQV